MASATASDRCANRRRLTWHGGLPLVLGLLLPCSLSGALAAGPMLGYADLREASVWFQTGTDAQVSVRYHPEGAPRDERFTEPMLTTPDAGFIGTRLLHPLEPDTVYHYEVWENGEPLPETTGRFRTPPARSVFSRPTDFTVAVAGGLAPEQDGSILERLAASEVDAMVWTGDFATLRPADWMTPRGYAARYQSARTAVSRPGWTDFPQYAALGPGDYGPPGATGRWAHRSTALAAFNAFWPTPAPAFPGEAAAHHFRWGDADFFVLDAFSFRGSYRSPERQRAVLGQAQIDWLIDALVTSDATFKIVVSGMSLLHPHEAPDALTSYKDEERALLSAIDAHQITGLFFLAGGRPVGELTRKIRAGGYPLYELLTGALTRPALSRDEYTGVNYFRVPGTLILQPHFVLLRFSGSGADRAVALSARDAQGEELWQERLLARDLQP